MSACIETQVEIANVLVVDDDDGVRGAVARILAVAGFQVDTACDGSDAIELLRGGSFNAVVSDLNMPTMDGLSLLRAIHAHDPDIPVILLTGDPSLATAMDAIEHGAQRYLLKPFNTAQLRQAVDDAVRRNRVAATKRELLEVRDLDGTSLIPRDELQKSFDRAMLTLNMAFQPIISWADRRVVGYEALARPSEPALPHPGALFAAAERLGTLRPLGRRIRALTAELMLDAPESALIFINLHTRDLIDEELYNPESPLARSASRIVLEITERAPLHRIEGVEARIAKLRQLGFRIAIDDLGAGYAGLTSLAQLEPDIIKLDLALVRGVEGEPTKQRLIRTMVGLCSDSGQTVIAEGVETEAERDTLIRLGCDWLQGFLFARPEKHFLPVTW